MCTVAPQQRVAMSGLSSRQTMHGCARAASRARASAALSAAESAGLRRSTSTHARATAVLISATIGARVGAPGPSTQAVTDEARKRVRWAGDAQSVRTNGRPERASAQLTSIRLRRPLPSAKGCTSRSPTAAAAARTWGSRSGCKRRGWGGTIASSQPPTPCSVGVPSLLKLPALQRTRPCEYGPRRPGRSCARDLRRRPPCTAI